MSKYCEVCDIVLLDKEYQRHVVGKKHFKNVRHQDFEKRIREHSIFVSPLPRYKSHNELIKFFQQFGSIAEYKNSNTYMIIEYNSREPVDYLLNNEISIDKYIFNIKRRNLYNVSKKTNANNSEKEVICPISIDIIRNKFENEATFNSQFAKFLDAIELKDTEILTSYNLICLHLNNIFSSIFPNCRTYKFGSTLTGLGFKESDLDIYMDIGEPIYTLDDEKQPKNGKQICNLWTMKKIFSKVKSVMYRMSDVFTSITPILKTRTPIIKFFYLPTKISCDISFKNSFGVYNCILLSNCLSYDTRIRPLIMLIKYWARQYQLTKCGLISNYALILMIIFYLQQPEQNILPPLMEFQKTCTPTFINGWQVNSDGNVILPKSSNDKNIPELLQGFYEFYINFDFKKNIICPLDGIIHSKQEFNDTESLPSYMIRYKEIVRSENVKLCVNAPVCVQDPIELNRNVTTTVYGRLIDLFQAVCVVGANLCRSSRADNYKNLLISLLEPLPLVNNQMQFRITIKVDRYLNVGLPDNFDKREDITDKDQYKKDNLFFMTFNIIKDILEKVFRMEIEILSTDNGTKQQKIEELSDVHTRDHEQLLLICKGNIGIWCKKRNKVTIFDPSISALEKETVISSMIAEKYIKNINSENGKLSFTCKLEKKENPVKIQLTFTNTSKEAKSFESFKDIATSRIPQITTKTLDNHMIKCEKVC